MSPCERLADRIKRSHYWKLTLDNVFCFSSWNCTMYRSVFQGQPGRSGRPGSPGPVGPPGRPGSQGSRVRLIWNSVYISWMSIYRPCPIAALVPSLLLERGWEGENKGNSPPPLLYSTLSTLLYPFCSPDTLDSLLLLCPHISFHDICM